MCWAGHYRETIILSFNATQDSKQTHRDSHKDEYSQARCDREDLHVCLCAG